jgi:hypothetical protein
MHKIQRTLSRHGSKGKPMILDVKGLDKNLLWSRKCVSWSLCMTVHNWLSWCSVPYALICEWVDCRVKIEMWRSMGRMLGKWSPTNHEILTPVMEWISSRALIGGAYQFYGSGSLSCSAIQIGGHVGTWEPTFAVLIVPPQTLADGLIS